MNLRLIRRWPKATCTIGELLIEGEWFCFTLEDVERPEKIPGETAIPTGRYALVITHSQRFDMNLPLLLNVPGFTGIRIHAGNTGKDTHGCILVGRRAYEGSIGESRLALEALMLKLYKAKEDIWITVEDGGDPTFTSVASGEPTSPPTA